VRPLPLRTRVAVTFGALSLIVGLAVGVITYQLVRTYLNDQREQFAVSRTTLDARIVDDQAQTAGRAPGDLLNSLPSTDGTQKLLRVGGTWFSSGVSVSPDDLPMSLLVAAGSTDGAMQRFTIGDSAYLAVAVPVEQGLYVEVFQLVELNRTLDLLRTSLAGATLLAILLAAAAGWWAAGRLLRPLRRLAQSADELATGNLTERMPTTSDSDIEPISTAFNSMADSMQDRIERERRFVANVSHELRTPLTVMLGTSEILDRRSTSLPDSDAELLTVMTQQVTRLAQTVLDLLELGTITPETQPEWEHVDAALVVSDVLRHREHDTSVMSATGDTSVVTDPRRLERIVANLVDNADRHGEGLTGVVVERRGEWLHICVDDDGPGVPVEERTSIFELFGRGSSSAPGTGSGLGLAIVAEQAELVQAPIRISESASGGARFEVVLPVDPQHPDLPREVS